MEAIEVIGVSKYYGDKKVLRDINLVIEDGESVVLLGPNGAGKSTLMRCILGLVRFEGKIRVMGLDVKRHGPSVRRLIGYVPQSARLPDEARIVDLVDLVSDLKGVDVYLEDVLDPFGLLDYAHRKVGELSGGMKQRLAIAISLIGGPRILLLDEPFNNLDATSRARLIDLLRSLRGERVLLMSVHDPSEVVPFVDRVVLMRDGCLVSEAQKSSLPGDNLDEVEEPRR